MTAQYNPEGELEKLYLLEILVDSLHLETSKINLADKGETLNKGTCVVFKFLNHPPLKVCEGDFCERDENPERNIRSIVFKSGKSCLFSLRNSSPPLACFKIRLFVEISKDEPPNLIIGKGCADLGETFVKILNSTTKDCELGPIIQSVRDKFSIINENNEDVGDINVFIRLSCFGKMIITQFQIADEEKETFFFKGNEKNMIGGAGEGSVATPCDPADTKRIPCSDKDTYQSPPIREGQATADEPPRQIPPQPKASQQYPSTPQYGGGFGWRPGLSEVPPFAGGYGGFGGQPFPCGPPTGLLGGNPDYSAGMTAFPDPRLQQQGQQFDMNFQNIPNRQGPKPPLCGKLQLVRESSSEEEDEVEQTPPQQVPLLNFCSCDYPLPPGFTVPVPSPPKKKKKKQKPTCPYDLGGKFCLMPQCPMGYPLYKKPTNRKPNLMEPDEIALLDDRVILQMPQLQQQSPFPMQQYPMPYPIGPPSFGMQQTADPTDVYSLRVGRVMAGAEQNSKVEVAFKSTAESPRKPCRYHAETQYIPEDFGGLSEPPSGDKGKKAGKGKGKKEKKGKK